MSDFMWIKIHLRTSSHSHGGSYYPFLVNPKSRGLVGQFSWWHFKMQFDSGKRVYPIFTHIEQNISPHDTVTMNSVQVSL